MATANQSDMPTRTLGRTGEKVSAIGLGGWHLALPHVDEALSLRIVRTAIDRGITFMDNCWDYNDGAERAPHGQGAARRLPGAGLPDDQDRRPVEEGGRPAARRVAAAAPDRPHRSGAASRDPPLRGPPPHLRPGGCQRCPPRRAPGRQAALHRLHRPQGPAHSPAHARGRRAARASSSTRSRCRST